MSLLTARQVEQQTGVPAARLARWRRRGIGPEYFHLGANTIRYSPDYINDWINDADNKALLECGRTGARRAHRNGHPVVSVPADSVEP